MIRKLFLLAVTAVAAVAFSAASASAVTVENPGEFEVTGENTIAIHSIVPEFGNAEVTGLKCDNHWIANIDAEGHIFVDPIEFAEHELSVGACDTANDCNDAGWEAQLEEANNHGWEFGVHVRFCLEGTGNPAVDGVNFLVECEVSAAGDEVHCGGPQPGDGVQDAEESESHTHDQVIAPGVTAEFNVEGELNIDPALELHH